MPEARAPDDVLEFLAKARTPRKRATRKLADVLGSLVVGTPPLDRVRAAWVFGSWARGAATVGDIDMMVQIDEARDPNQQALDAYYRRGHPYAEVVKAMGCGGASMVSVDVQPVFELDPQPISPWRCERLKAARRPLDRCAVPELPPIGHAVTGDLFDPQPQLVWARGDSPEDVDEQLARFPQLDDARRQERTTTVPVIDDLLERLGVQTGFRLAVQIKAGSLALRPFLVQPRDIPERYTEALYERYTPGSARGRALGCLLADLQDAGVDVEAVQLMGETTVGTMVDHAEYLAQLARGASDPPPPRRRLSQAGNSINIGFNAFTMYLVASGRFEDGERHIHMWTGSRRGPWLAVEIHGLNAGAAQDVDRRLGYTRDSNVVGFRELLRLGPLPHS